MKIGLFTDTYFPQINGVGTSTYTLANQLRGLGHTVYIFTPSDPNVTHGVYEKDVIRMPSMPFVFIHGFRVGLVYSPLELSKIAMLNLDIVHTQSEFSLGMFGKTFSKIFGIPMVHTYHTMYEDYVHYIVNGYLITTSMAHFLSKTFCNFASEVIAPTAKVSKSLLEYGVTRAINIIPTGINTEKFNSENYSAKDTLDLKLSLGLKENDKVILFVGRIAKEKSIDVIMKSLPKVFSESENVKFLVVGDGPYRQTLQHQAKDLNIDHLVIFAGAKPWAEIGKYYQVGDIFVSASVSETQGLTFIEAMAAKLPVLAKNDPCIEGVIENGENGLVFETNLELSLKILELLNNNNLYNYISTNASAFAKNLSEENFAKKVEAVYEDVLEEAKNSGTHLVPTLFAGKVSLENARKVQVRKFKRIAKYEMIQLKRARRRLNKMTKAPIEKLMNNANITDKID